MSSRQNMGIQATTDQVTSSIEKHAIPAAEALDAEQPEGERLELGKALGIVARWAAREASRVEASSALVHKEVAEDRTARGVRDEVFTQAKTDLSLLASSVVTVYGRAYAESLKLTGSTPESPSGLVEAIDAFAAVSDPLPKAPAPRVAFTSIDLAGARASLVEASAAIKKAIQATTHEVRETQAARVERDTTTESWRRHADFAADLGRAVLVFQGQRDLADRMFPSTSTTRDVAEDVRTEQPAPTPTGGNDPA